MTRKLLIALVGVGLLLTVAFADVRVHALAAAVAWGLVRVVDEPVSRNIGRPSRWLFALVVLGLFGALIGPRDASLVGHGVSLGGALAATTMIGRGLGITFLTSGLVELIPRDRLLSRLAKTPFAHLAEGISVAIGLVPALSRELVRRAADVKRPRRFSPVRWHRTAIAIVRLTRTMATEAAIAVAERRGSSRALERDDRSNL